MPGLRGKGGIRCTLESQCRGFVDVDVVRVAVAAHRIESHDDVWPDLADVATTRWRHLFHRMGDLSIRMLVVWLAPHARIPVAQEVDL